MKELKKQLTNPYVYVFLATYYGIWLWWEFIQLPFSNPAGIISYLPSIGYNPTNNIVRFVFAILFPPLACLLFWWLNNGGKKFFGSNRLRKIVAGMLIAGSLLLCVGMGIVQNSTNPKNNPVGQESSHAQIDSFHEGEALGPAVSYQDPNLKPYKDYVFVHGVFQDPGRAVLAFKVFGRSIGAVRAMATILTIITFMMVYALLLVLFKGNILKSSFGLSLFGLVLTPTATLPFIGKYIVGIQLPFRDITTIIILISAIFAFRYAAKNHRLYTALASGVIGFMACINFANSMDRAIYGVFIALFWLVLMAFVSKQKMFTRTILPAFTLGGLLGIPVVGMALKWDFIDFIRFIKTISHYKEYLDGMPFTRPEVPISLLLIATSVGITILGAWFLKVWQATKKSKRTFMDRVKLLRSPITNLINQHFVVILLFVTGVLFLRSAIGRADIGHFIYSIQWLYILGIFLFVRWLFDRKTATPLLIYLSILVFVITLGFFMGSVKKIDLARDAFPINVSDDKFVRQDHLQTAQFLRDNLSGDENFVTLTSEASWYYLVNKPSPVQYPIVWFAFMPQQRQSLAASIQNNDNIKYIITNNNWTSTFDYVPVNERLPEVFDILYKQYEPVQGFGQQTVWQRK